MAITKMVGAIHPRKNGSSASLMAAIDYALNPEKTEGFCYGQGCLLSDRKHGEQAYQEMMQTKRHFGKAGRSPSERLGYHFMISFSPDEAVSPETALEVGKEFCAKYLNGYECVIGVHNDQEHKHLHIIFNSVNYETGRKYHYNDGDWANMIQPLVDSLCEGHGLHRLSEDTGIPLEEYEEQRRKRRREKQSGNGRHYDNWKQPLSGDTEGGGMDFSMDDIMRQAVDDAIRQSRTFPEFVDAVRRQGYTFEKRGKFWRLKAPGKKGVRRMRTLGDAYTEEAVAERLLHKEGQKKVDIPVCREYVYQFPVRMQYMRIRVTPYTDFQKREYVRLYRLGIRPVGEKPDYRRIRAAWREVRAITRRMELMEQERVLDMPGIRKKIAELKTETDREVPAWELKQKKEKMKDYEIILKNMESFQKECAVDTKKTEKLGREYDRICREMAQEEAKEKQRQEPQEDKGQKAGRARKKNR